MDCKYGVLDKEHCAILTMCHTLDEVKQELELICIARFNKEVNGLLQKLTDLSEELQRIKSLRVAKQKTAKKPVKKLVRKVVKKKSQKISEDTERDESSGSSSSSSSSESSDSEEEQCDNDKQADEIETKIKQVSEKLANNQYQLLQDVKQNVVLVQIQILQN